MYKKAKYSKTMLNIENTNQGESIEEKVYRLIQNKEPIKDGAPTIYTERSAGVNPAYNIRTDRWEIATDAMTRLLKSREAKRDELIKKAEAEADKEKEGKIIKGDFGRPESIQGKADNQSK